SSSQGGPSSHSTGVISLRKDVYSKIVVTYFQCYKQPCGPSDFPLAICGFPPRGAFLMPIKLSKNRGGQSVQNPPPDICILTLAMMIAGIPTVPVPGIKEEDLIRAAQNFMTENPEQGVQGQRTPKRTGDAAQFWKKDRQRKRPVDRGFQPPSIAHFEK
uniref:Uncharacterized protein n=1 Tax=Chelydra serpentina TaxID=8475 RepID=A0A8C3SWW5_CHESE